MSSKPEGMLGNRYRVIGLLGAGGMGSVYRAWDTRLDVAVAVKEMIPQPGLDAATLDALRQQFRQEATVLARLDHPNLVRVTDFFEDRGNAYLVMNFVEGESLFDRIKRQGEIPESHVLGWAAQLLSALSYCHAKGIIHRDIKPQNVLIRPDGQAVLVDFGLVKLWNPNDPRTKTAMRGMGTPEYSPPEQYDTQISHTDPRSDVYSLGATLYHALAGHAPPTATNRIADPEHFAYSLKSVQGVSDRTQSAVLKALTLARSQRWPSAAAMGEAMGLQIPIWKEGDTGPKMGDAGRGGTQKMPEPAARTAVAAPAMPAYHVTGAPAYPAAPPRERPRIPVWVLGVAVVIVLALAVGGAFAAGIIRIPASKPATIVPKPSATVAATATATATPTQTPTRTPTPSPTPTTTPTPAPTSLPLPELTAPDDDAGYYTTSWVPLTWTWFQDLEEGQRFEVLIEDANGKQVLSHIVEPGAELKYSFKAVTEGLPAGRYTWRVQAQRQSNGEWEVAAESLTRKLRIVERPPDTPTPVPAQPPAPSETPPGPTQPPPPPPPPPPPTYTPEPP